MVSGVGRDARGLRRLIDKYRDRRLADRVFDLAWTHSQVVLRQINASEADAQLYERLAGLMLYRASRRCAPSRRCCCRTGAASPGSGARRSPATCRSCCCSIGDAANIDLVRQMVQAHAYWRLKGLAVDLVIWNEDRGGYRQQLQDQIMGLIAAGVEANVIDRPGGIFVRPAQQIVAGGPHPAAVGGAGDRQRRQRHARRTGRSPAAAGHAGAGVRAQPGAGRAAAVAAERRDRRRRGGRRSVAVRPCRRGTDPRQRHRRLRRGRPRIRHRSRRRAAATPAPWCNVLANAHFGCVAQRQRAGLHLERERARVPAHAVAQRPGRRRRRRGVLPARRGQRARSGRRCRCPVRGEGAYRTRHGFGYSVFEHVEDGIASELWIYVGARGRGEVQRAASCATAPDARGGCRRPATSNGCSATCARSTQMHVITEVDGDSGVLTARNPYNTEFARPGRVLRRRCDAERRAASPATAPNSSAATAACSSPAALLRERLSGRIGAGLDPCAAIQVPIELGDGQARRDRVPPRAGPQLGRRGRAGAGARAAATPRTMRSTRCASTGCARSARCSVETPDPASTCSPTAGCCTRPSPAAIWRAAATTSPAARSASATSCRTRWRCCTRNPRRARATPAAQRARTSSPKATCSTGGIRRSTAACARAAPTITCGCRWRRRATSRSPATPRVLDERVSLLEGRPVNPDEESYYDLPTRSGLRETLYEHCVRALQRGLSLLGRARPAADRRPATGTTA